MISHIIIYFLISYITAKGPTLQPPGSFIPLDLHHLLKQDFVEFEVDEYVGYELDDPEMYNQSGDATYIYATIIEKLPVSCWYQIKYNIYRRYNRWQAIQQFLSPETQTFNVFSLCFSAWLKGDFTLLSTQGVGYSLLPFLLKSKSAPKSILFLIAQ